MRRGPYIEDAWEVYWDLISVIWCHYRTPRLVDGIVLSVADKCERDGNAERADWLRRVVAGEEVDR